MHSDDREAPDGARIRKLTAKVPLDDTGNMQDIGPLNGVNWFSERFGFDDVTIEMVSHEMQMRESEARCEAIAKGAETVLEASKAEQLKSEVIEFPQPRTVTEWEQDCLDAGEPITPLLTPDLNLPEIEGESREKLQTSFPKAFYPDEPTVYPAERCYDSQQTANKIGVPVKTIQCNKELQKQLQVQQNRKGSKLLFPKCVVNQMRRDIIDAKKNGLVLSH